MPLELRVFKTAGELSALALQADLLQDAARVMVDAFRHHPNGRMMYACPDGDHRACLHRLKMLYQCIKPTSYVVMAFDTQPVIQDPDENVVEGEGECKLVGVLAATRTFQDFADNASAIPPAILDEWKRLSEPMGPSNAVLIAEHDSEKVETGLESWHVPLIAVSPAFQSQGIGSKLLDGFHAFIQGEASSLYSATPRLMAAYGRHGYELARHPVMMMPDGETVDFDLLVRQP